MWDNKMINNDNINKKLDKLVILKRLKKKNKKSKEEENIPIWFYSTLSSI